MRLSLHAGSASCWIGPIYSVYLDRSTRASSWKAEIPEDGDARIGEQCQKRSVHTVSED